MIDPFKTESRFNHPMEESYERPFFNMSSKYTVLVNSSDGFEDCWEPFFKLFNKYWPSCDAPILLNTEKKEWSFPGLTIHCSQVQGDSKSRLTWSECLLKALDQVKTPLVLYFQEDYFIHQPVRADIVETAANYMMAHPDIKHIALTKHGSHGPFERHSEDWLQTIRQKARYRISTQAALWRVETLKSYLRAKENGWMFEIYGTWRAHKIKETFLSAKFDQAHGGPAIDYLHTGIIKGKWLKAIQPVFEKNGIKIDYSLRGFYIPKHPLVRKFEVLKKLIENSWLFDQTGAIKIFRSSLLVTLLTLSGSALGFFVQLLIAKHFGTKVDVDAYFFALSAPIFLAGMIAAMLSYIVVPRLVALEKDVQHQRHYMGSLLWTISILSLVFGLIGFFVFPIQKSLLPTTSKIISYPNLQFLIVLTWFTGAFQILSGLLTACLNSVRKYSTGAILGILPYIGMLILLGIGGNNATIALVPLGMLIGTMTATGLGLYWLRDYLFPLELNNFLKNEIKELLLHSPYVVIAMSCFSAYSVIDSYWAPRAGDGALASLGYSQRLIIALGNLAVAGPSAVLVPHFAEFIRDKNVTGFRRFLVRSLLVVGGISTLIALFLAAFSEKLIHILFARGAFGDQQVVLVSSVLRHMTPGMVCMLMSVIALRALFCTENSKKIAAILGFSWMVLYFITSYFLYPAGAASLAWGYSIVWLGYLTFICFILFKRNS